MQGDTMMADDEWTIESLLTYEDGVRAACNVVCSECKRGTFFFRGSHLKPTGEDVPCAALEIRRALFNDEEGDE